MLGPPVFTTQEEADAYLDAQKDIYGGGAAGVARGLGIVDLFAGVPWLAGEAAGQATMASLLQQRDRLERHTDRKTADYLSRLDLRSKGALGDKESQEKARNIIAGRSGTYDEAIEEFLKTFGYERNERSKIAEDVSFWITVGVDGAFLLNVIRKAAPKGYRAVRDALKNIGKNVDETDQAVMKAQTELGFSDTPVQMEMDLPKAKAKPVKNTQEQLYALDTRLYDLNNILKQEGGLMSNTNLQKLRREISKVENEIRKLTAAGAATGITVSGEAKSPGAEEVQSSVNYALKQWM
tara:strand:- start:656 stop:1540 length:885 start_codon:yes stop_codon:yes gene_type:complete